MYVCHDDMNYRLYTQNIIITQKLKTFNQIFNSNSNQLGFGSDKVVF